MSGLRITVQSVGLTVELPNDDPRCPAYVDVDREASRIDTTQRTPGAPEMTSRMKYSCWL